MRDPWKYVAFPSAAVIGYLISLSLVTEQFAAVSGLSENYAQYAVIALSGLVAGFMVDEVIPTYLEHVRSGGGGGAGDMDFDSDGGDFDFDS